MTLRGNALVLTGLLMLGSVLAACSSGDSTSASAPAPAASVAATSTAASASGASSATATATAVATPAAGGPAEVVGLSLAEFGISGTGSVAAGRVTFEVSNSGMSPHNLRVVQSDLAPDALPQKDGMVDESSLDVLAKTEDIQQGGDDLEVDAELTAGRYLMFCNVVGHYQLGMVKELIVQ